MFSFTTLNCITRQILSSLKKKILSCPTWCLSCCGIKTPHYTTHRQSNELQGRGKLIPHQSAVGLPRDGRCQAYNTSLWRDVVTNQVKFVQSRQLKETRETDVGLIIGEDDQVFRPYINIIIISFIIDKIIILIIKRVNVCRQKFVTQPNEQGIF